MLQDLLRASTSSQGYHKLTGQIRAEEVLHHLRDERAIFSPAYFYVTIFGSPSDDTWAWMLTGHHMTATFTVAGDRTGFTPMFTGAQPLQIPDGVFDTALRLEPQHARHLVRIDVIGAHIIRRGRDDLDLALFGRHHMDGRARGLELVARNLELGLLEAVGGEDGHFLAGNLHGSPPLPPRAGGPTMKTR